MAIWSEVTVVPVSSKREEGALWWLPSNCVWAALKDWIAESHTWKETWNNIRKSRD